MRCSRPWITALEKKYVNEALDVADIGQGEFLPRFEEAWANYNKYKYGVVSNSGTNAIFLALKALGIKEGDEVIVPEFTMVATAWAVTYTGAKPIFVDCLPDLTMNPDLVKAAITPKTKALITVPIYGRNVSKKVYDIARESNIFVVEDMAEAHGIMPMGDIACYSFHASKIITTGGGGMCLTNNIEYAKEMKLYCHLYLDKDMTMLHPKMGYNFRMSNIQAAVGLAQVERISEILAKRKEVEGWYNDLIPEHMRMPEREVVWVYDINCGENQKLIKDKLAKADIESRYFFKTMSQQPMYLGNYEKLEAYKWSQRGLYIPLYPEMTKAEVESVVKVIKS